MRSDPAIGRLFYGCARRLHVPCPGTVVEAGRRYRCTCTCHDDDEPTGTLDAPAHPELDAEALRDAEARAALDHAGATLAELQRRGIPRGIPWYPARTDSGIPSGTP